MCQAKTIIYPLSHHSAYDHETWQNDNLSWKAPWQNDNLPKWVPTYKVTLLFDHITLQDHMAN